MSRENRRPLNLFPTRSEKNQQTEVSFVSAAAEEEDPQENDNTPTGTKDLVTYDFFHMADNKGSNNNNPMEFSGSSAYGGGGFCSYAGLPVPSYSQFPNTNNIAYGSGVAYGSGIPAYGSGIPGYGSGIPAYGTAPVDYGPRTVDYLSGTNRGTYFDTNKALTADYDGKVCGACGRRETPTWRKGEGSQILCNACGLKHSRIMKNKDKK